MSQRTKVVGARTPVIWLLIVISLIVIAALAVGGLVIYPQMQKQQAEQARAAEAEQHYQAGLAFQNVGDVDKATQEYEKVIVLDANYKDAQSRLAEVKVQLAGSAATATAVAQATVAAGPTATAAALEAHYQKGLGYMNIGRWQEARAELEQVFAVNPNYNDVQAKLKEAEAKLTQLSPTIIPTRRVVAATVQANGEWQNSGVTVQAGQRITLAASGRWSHGQSNYGPEGYDKYDNSAVLPSAKIGSLIGRIGSGRPFLIGTSLSLTANDDGVLQLSMNDAVGTFGDNDGSVTAQIDVQ